MLHSFLNLVLLKRYMCQKKQKKTIIPDKHCHTIQGHDHRRLGGRCESCTRESTLLCSDLFRNMWTNLQQLNEIWYFLKWHQIQQVAFELQRPRPYICQSITNTDKRIDRICADFFHGFGSVASLSCLFFHIGFEPKYFTLKNRFCVNKEGIYLPVEVIWKKKGAGGQEREHLASLLLSSSYKDANKERGSVMAAFDLRLGTSSVILCHKNSPLLCVHTFVCVCAQWRRDLKYATTEMRTCEHVITPPLFHWPHPLLRQHHPLRLCCRQAFYLLFASDCVDRCVLTPVRCGWGCGATWPITMKDWWTKVLGVSKMLHILTCKSSILGGRKVAWLNFFLFGFPLFGGRGERKGGLVWSSGIFNICSCTIWRRGKKRTLLILQGEIYAKPYIHSSNCCEFKGTVRHDYNIYYLFVC